MKRTRQSTRLLESKSDVAVVDSPVASTPAAAAAAQTSLFSPVRGLASPAKPAAKVVGSTEEAPASKKQKGNASVLPVPSPPAADGVARASPAVLSFDDRLLTQPMEAYSAEFDRIARELMLDYELRANGHRLRLMEIEFYWRGDERPGVPSHHDPFTHAHPLQRDNFGRWYLHRQGVKPDASYKGGSYKGVDVTFGPSGGGGYGGILIRSVQRISDGTIIEGPCLVAEEILRMHRVDSLVSLVAGWGGDTCAFTGPSLYFTPAQHRETFTTNQPVMVKSPRVGLTLKQDGETRPLYLMQPYRYTRLPAFNKKMKNLIVCSASQGTTNGPNGHDEEEQSRPSMEHR